MNPFIFSQLEPYKMLQKRAQTGYEKASEVCWDLKRKNELGSADPW